MYDSLYFRCKSSWFARPYVVLFLVALGLRLLMFFIMLDQIGIERMKTTPQDAGAYWRAAEAISEDFNFDNLEILTFGPGFPLILAFFGVFLKLPVACLFLLQHLVGAASTVILARTALALTDRPRESLLAGFLNALSFTSAALSCLFLSETFFFAVIVTGFYFLITGARENRDKNIYIAGALFCAALFIRSVAQHLWIIVFIVVIALRWPRRRREFKPFMRSLIAPTIIGVLTLSVVAAWSARNDRLYGVSYASLAQPGGVAQVVRLSQARIEKKSVLKIREEYESRVDSLTSVRSQRPRVFTEYTAKTMAALWAEHRSDVIAAFLLNVMDNIGNDLCLQGVVFPNWVKQYSPVTTKMGEWKFHYRVPVLSLLGLLVLFWRRMYAPAIILFVVFSYFALSTGFTLWQGTRPFYPGQVAWTILVAFALYLPFSLIKRPVNDRWG